MASVKSSRSAVDSSRSRSSKTKGDEVEKSSSRSTGRGGDILPKIGREQDDKPADDYDDEVINAPVMFGDPFGNRGDYSKGIFYGGRNKFLYSKDSKNEKGEKPASLEPPLDFMTRRQRRNKAKLSTTQVQLVSKRLDFKRKDENDEAAAAARAEAKKNMQQSKRKVLVIKHHSTSKYDWVLQKQAGCKFWVHKPTGTISNEKPYCEDEDDSICTSDQESLGSVGTPQKQRHNSFMEEDSRGEEFDEDLTEPPATGSLVYDSTEVQNFLSILDEMQANEEAKKAARLKKKEAEGKS